MRYAEGGGNARRGQAETRGRLRREACVRARPPLPRDPSAERRQAPRPPPRAVHRGAAAQRTPGAASPGRSSGGGRSSSAPVPARGTARAPKTRRLFPPPAQLSPEARHRTPARGVSGTCCPLPPPLGTPCSPGASRRAPGSSALLSRRKSPASRVPLRAGATRDPGHETQCSYWKC